MSEKVSLLEKHRDMIENTCKNKDLRLEKH